MNKITFYSLQPACKTLALGAMMLLGSTAIGQTRHYVKTPAAGTADGTTWDNAGDDLQAAINAAAAGDTIWVAGGTYKPNRKITDLTTITPSDRDNAFVLKDSVQIYGGFAGVEAAFADRDLTLNENASILSGDFMADDSISGSADSLTFNHTIDNAYRVVFAKGIDTIPVTRMAVLDGFTITGGNGSNISGGSVSVGGITIPRSTGGGIANYNYSSPTLSNLVFINNAAAYGGAIYNKNNSSPAISNVTIRTNIATTGGGITNWDTSLPTLNNVTIDQNIAEAGGGIYNFNGSAIVLNSVSITGNYATTGAGGGMFNNASSPVINTSSLQDNTSVTYGGGIFNTLASAPLISGTAFTGNASGQGGGIYNSSCSPVITGSSFDNNTAGTAGGGIYNSEGSTPLFTQVNFTGNTAATYGGGVANWTASTSIYTNVTFTNNTANMGGGVFNNSFSVPTFVSATFTGNTASGNGGAMYNFDNSSPIVTNALFAHNSGVYGGAVYNQNASSPVFTNATFTQNTATTSGGAVSDNDSNPLFRNSILYGNTAATAFSANVFNFGASVPQFAYSIVQGTATGWDYIGTNLGGNVDADPLFYDTANGDYRNTFPSPATNAGSNAYYSPANVPNLSAITLDLLGQPRFFGATAVDMGAYEYQGLAGIAANNKLNVTAYPNPVTNLLNINSSTGITGAEVYNMLGQKMGTATYNGVNNTIDMAALQTGQYIVKIVQGKASQSLLVIRQ